ncbi:hypothetical protein [Aromatoleum aromaticum]|nr:hypothetical protein [Aromatoleum aromaticum]
MIHANVEIGRNVGFDDARKEHYDHMSGYAFTLDGDMVEMRPKVAAAPQLSLLFQHTPSVQLSPHAYEQGRTLAPGSDIHGSRMAGVAGEEADRAAKPGATLPGLLQAARALSRLQVRAVSWPGLERSGGTRPAIDTEMSGR